MSARGRPRVIDHRVLAELLAKDYELKRLAQIFGCSVKTVRNSIKRLKGEL